MTVSQSIEQWLEQNPTLEILGVQTDMLNETGISQSEFGIFKTPQDSIRRFIDGGYEKTQYFMLLVRQSAIVNSDRINNQAWLETLEAWIYEKDVKAERPVIEGHNVKEISMSGGWYMQEMTAPTAIYQLILKIRYGKIIKNQRG